MIEFVVPDNATSRHYDLVGRVCEIWCFNAYGRIGIFLFWGDTKNRDLVVVSPVSCIMPRSVRFFDRKVTALSGEVLSQSFLKTWIRMYGPQSLTMKTYFSKSFAATLTGRNEGSVLFVRKRGEKKRKFDGHGFTKFLPSVPSSSFRV